RGGATASITGRRAARRGHLVKLGRGVGAGNRAGRAPRRPGQKRVPKLNATVGGPSADGPGSSSSRPPAPIEALPMAESAMAVTSLPSLAATMAPEVMAAAPAPASSQPITSRFGLVAGLGRAGGFGGGAAASGGIVNVYVPGS